MAVERPEFVGREAEHALLASRLEAAVAGEGQLVLVAGEAGIGKSRLAAEAVKAAAASGVECGWGRVSDDEGSPPYWPFRQLLRALAEPGRVSALGALASDLAFVAPEFGGVAQEGAGGAQQRFRSFEAVTRFLGIAAEPSGLLVVLDDVQWADPGSLQLLVHLARGAAGARLLVVVIYRDTETGGRPALREALSALGREPVVTRVRLVGLTEAQVTAQLAGVTGRAVPAAVVAAVSRRSQGNPFFVAEIGRLLDGGPGGDGAAAAGKLPAGCGMRCTGGWPGCQSRVGRWCRPHRCWDQASMPVAWRAARSRGAGGVAGTRRDLTDRAAAFCAWSGP